MYMYVSSCMCLRSALLRGALYFWASNVHAVMIQFGLVFCVLQFVPDLTIKLCVYMYLCL